MTSEIFANGKSVSIVEVGPRDGFQSIKPLIPTEQKISIVQKLFDCGLRRIEATSFVSQSALPQMADAQEVMNFAQSLPDLDCQVLIPSLHHAMRALEAGARHLSFVVSVSEPHNMGNVRRTPLQSVEEYKEIIKACSDDVTMRINIATSFDCPHAGKVAIAHVIELMEQIVPIAPDAEFALCDTTGRANPQQVTDLFAALFDNFGRERKWAFHAHDTYGMGLANVWAAWLAGVTTIDAALAGAGGCPYAPGAKGNVATEDLVWMFESAGVDTGIDTIQLVEASRVMEQIPGAQLGGSVRAVLTAAG